MEVNKTKGDDLINEINMLVIGGNEEERKILLTSPYIIYQVNDTLRDKIIQLFSDYFSAMLNDGILTDDLYVDLERIDKILEKEMLTNIVHLIIDSSLTGILYRVKYGPYGHFFSHLLFKGGDKNHDILYRSVISQEGMKNVNRVVDAMTNVISPDRKFIDGVLGWKKGKQDTYMDLLIKQKNFITITYIDQLLKQEAPHVNSDIYTKIIDRSFEDYEDFLYKLYTSTRIGMSYLIDMDHPMHSDIYKIAFLCARRVENENNVKINHNNIVSAIRFIRRIEKFLNVNFLDNKIRSLFGEKQNPLRPIIENMILSSSNHYITEEMKQIIHSFESTTNENSNVVDSESELRVIINTLNNKKLSRNDYSQLAMIFSDYADSYTTFTDKTSTQNFIYYLKRYHDITSAQSAEIAIDSLKMIEQIMTKIILKLSVKEITEYLYNLYNLIIVFDFPALKTIMTTISENDDSKGSKITLSILKKYAKKENIVKPVSV